MESVEKYSDIISNLRKIITDYYWNQKEVEVIILNSGLIFALELFSKATEVKFNQHLIDVRTIDNCFIIKLLGLYPDFLKNKNVLIIDKVQNKEKLEFAVNFLKSYEPKALNYVSLIPAIFRGI